MQIESSEVMAMLMRADERGLVRSYIYLTGEEEPGAEITAETLRPLIEALDQETLRSASRELYKLTAVRHSPLVVDMGGPQPVISRAARGAIGVTSAKSIFQEELARKRADAPAPRKRELRGARLRGGDSDT